MNRAWVSLMHESRQWTPRPIRPFVLIETCRHTEGLHGNGYMRHDLEDADWLYAIAIVGGALWLSESRGGRVFTASSWSSARSASYYVVCRSSQQVWQPCNRWNCWEEIYPSTCNASIFKSPMLIKEECLKLPWVSDAKISRFAVFPAEEGSGWVRSALPTKQ